MTDEPTLPVSPPAPARIGMASTLKKEEVSEDDLARLRAYEEKLGVEPKGTVVAGAETQGRVALNTHFPKMEDTTIDDLAPYLTRREIAQLRSCGRADSDKGQGH